MALQLEDSRRKRIDALRELCKGEGITDNKPLAEALGYEADKFKDVLAVIMEVLPNKNIYFEAFWNALGADEGKNLTLRRGDFLAANPDVKSARTLMRYEQEGVELFVKCVELAEEQLERRKVLDEEEEEARDIDIQVLRERVSKLEEVLAEKSVTIDNLTSKLEEMAWIESSLQEAHSLIQEQSRTFAEATQRISDLETMLYCYAEHVDQVLFRNSLTGALSGQTYDEYPAEYSVALGSVGYRARKRLSGDS